jgi:hypothetical protein
MKSPQHFRVCHHAPPAQGLLAQGGCVVLLVEVLLLQDLGGPRMSTSTFQQRQVHKQQEALCGTPSQEQ